MDDYEEIFEKYESEILKQLNSNNINEIIAFLRGENCDYVEELLTDYLDLFLFEYDEFVFKYNILNQKYNNKFLIMASEDMNLWEEFYIS